MKKNHVLLELDKIILKLIDEFILESNILKYQKEPYLSNDIKELNKLLDCVEEAFYIISRSSRFPLYFRTDVSFLIGKCVKSGVLSSSELVEVSNFLDSVKNMINYNETLDTLNIPHDNYEYYVKKLVYPKELNLRIKEIVNPYGEILDTASLLIKSIRNQIKNTSKEISLKLNEIVSKNASKLTSSIISLRNDRYVISVKNDFKNQFKGITHDVSSSKETVFIEPLVINSLNNKLNSLEEELKKEIERILKDISNKISLESEILINNYNLIEYLDEIFSKASLSIKLKGNRVNINNKGIVELLNTHHPLLESENIVSNNILIGKDYQGIIITGPNTGGKTVLLKTIGLLSLMTKMGLLIPCESCSNINIFDDVYVDIGDEQSISQNLSTFSSHLKNIIEIINNITYNSLVLFDELGSGTDPTEGAYLAISILEYVLSKKCLVIATSHYAELKVYAYNSTNLINASVEFDIKTLKPTYKLLIGIPGESNALKISESLGLPKEIIDKAKNYAYNNTSEVNNTLNKLINQSLTLDNKLTDISKKDKLLKEKLIEIDNLKEETLKERSKILNEASVESSKLIKNSLLKVESILKELQENKDLKQHEIASIKYEVKQLNSDFEVQETKIKTDSVINVSDKVYIESYNAYGIVIKINKNRYDVSVGNTVITLKKDDLKLTNQEVSLGKTLKKNVTITPRKTVFASLDLRGFRYEEADPLIDDYLIDAKMAGLNLVSIIHGFGTGVIRELVHNKIKKNSYVESYRYGGQNEGGLGVTVVTLK